MKAWVEILRWLAGMLSLGAFGLALAGSLGAGVDPFWALLRAGASSAGVMVTFSILCRALTPMIGSPGAGAASTPPDAGRIDARTGLPGVSAKP